MWRSSVVLVFSGCLMVLGTTVTPRSGEELVAQVVDNCSDMGCVKRTVLGYLDNVLNLESEAKSSKNLDSAIFKRAARVLQTHEFRFKLPEMLFDQTELVYNPSTGLDVSVPETESRGLLKKKLLLPILLLLKLKMKALMPIFVAIIGLKATKALILSKLAIVIVIGFVIYQLCMKSGMPMPMSMMPAAPVEAPPSLYGPPSGPSSPPTNSYEPGWEPNQGGPYSRVWTSMNTQVDDPQRMAYAAYYPGAGSSSTSRP